MAFKLNNQQLVKAMDELRMGIKRFTTSDLIAELEGRKDIVPLIYYGPRGGLIEFNVEGRVFTHASNYRLYAVLEKDFKEITK